MRLDPPFQPTVGTDEWLESRCQLVEQAGRELAQAVGEVNQRVEQAQNGSLGRKQKITSVQISQAEAACKALHDVQVAIQNALFDCEHEMRELREREVSPAELLVEGDRLIRQYRFLRRRGRVIDGLLAYLPIVTHHANLCLETLRQLREGEAEMGAPMVVPDCGFALVALDQLREEDPQSRL